MSKFVKQNKNELISNVSTSNSINPTSNTAVTLVALVITIIVLLILSGITLNMVMGDSGIFKKAQLAKEETRKSTIIEIADRTALEEKAKAPMESNDVILKNTMDSLKSNDELKQIGSVSTSGKEFLIVDKSIFKIDLKNGTKYVNEQSGNEIILSEGDIKFTYVPEELTNSNVKVKIEANTTSMSNYTIQYKTENEDWKEYTQEIEIEKNCDIYARLQSIEGTSAVATGTIANIDKLEPKEFTPKVTATSNSIDIEAKTEDQERTKDNSCSGNIQYRFSKDNGSTWTEYQESGNYEFKKLTQNTTYNIIVEAKDKAGNTQRGKIMAGTGKVEGIETGDILFSVTPSEMTNENVDVEITGNKTGLQLQYKTEKNGEKGEVANWTNYTGKITITRNQSIYARVVDNEGQAGETYATGTIANIDKLPPNIFIPTLIATQNSIEVTTSTTDQVQTSDNACSGNIQYRFSRDNGITWTTYQTSGRYTFTGLTSNTQYNIVVEAKDKAGNTIQAKVSKSTQVAATLTLASTSGKVVSGNTINVAIAGSNYGTLSCSSGNTNVATASIRGTTLSVTGKNNSGTQSTTITVEGSNGGRATYTITSHVHSGNSSSGGGCYGISNTGTRRCNGNITGRTDSSTCYGSIYEYTTKYSDSSSSTGYTVKIIHSCSNSDCGYYKQVYSGSCSESFTPPSAKYVGSCGRTYTHTYYACNLCGYNYSSSGTCNRTISYTYYTINCGY